MFRSPIFALKERISQHDWTIAKSSIQSYFRSLTDEQIQQIIRYYPHITDVKDIPLSNIIQVADELNQHLQFYTSQDALEHMFMNSVGKMTIFPQAILHILADIPDGSTNDKYRNSYVWKIKPNVKKTDYDLEQMGGLANVVADIFYNTPPVYINLEGREEVLHAHSIRKFIAIFIKIILANKDIANQFTIEKLENITLSLKPESLKNLITANTGHDPLMNSTIKKTIAYYNQATYAEKLSHILLLAAGEDISASLLNDINHNLELQSAAALLEIEMRMFSSSIAAIPAVPHVFTELKVSISTIDNQIKEEKKLLQQKQTLQDKTLQIKTISEIKSLANRRESIVADMEFLERVKLAFFIKTHFHTLFKGPVNSASDLAHRKHLFEVVKRFLSKNISKIEASNCLSEIDQTLNGEIRHKIDEMRRQKERRTLQNEQIISQPKLNDFIAAIEEWGIGHKLISVMAKIVNMITENREIFIEILKSPHDKWSARHVDTLFNIIFPRAKFCINGGELQREARKNLSLLINAEAVLIDKNKKAYHPHEKFMELFASHISRSEIRLIRAKTTAKKLNLEISSSTEVSLLPASTTEKKTSVSRSTASERSSLLSPVSLDDEESEYEVEASAENSMSNRTTEQNLVFLTTSVLFTPKPKETIFSIFALSPGPRANNPFYDSHAKTNTPNIDNAIDLLSQYSPNHSPMDFRSNLINIIKTDTNITLYLNAMNKVITIKILEKLEAFPALLNVLHKRVLHLIGNYLAKFFIDKINGHNFHFYRYGILTAEVPGFCIAESIRNLKTAELLTQLVNLMGVARDSIIESKGCGDFVRNVKAMISDLYEHEHLSSEEKKILLGIKDHVIDQLSEDVFVPLPNVLSRESIINHFMMRIHHVADPKNEDMFFPKFAAVLEAMKKSLWEADPNYGSAHLSQKAFAEDVTRRYSRDQTSAKSDAESAADSDNRKKAISDYLTQSTGTLFRLSTSSSSSPAKISTTSLRQEIFDGIMQYLHDYAVQHTQLFEEKLHVLKWFIREIGRSGDEIFLLEQQVLEDKNISIYTSP